MYIISIKGYGDALIALWAINKLKDKSKFRLVTASYIYPLIRHLRRQDDTIVMPNILTYPEIYNLRNSTLSRCFSSVNLIRREIIENCNIREEEFLFDNFGFREFLIKPIFAKYKSVSVVKADNIYDGYLRVLTDSSEAKIFKNTEKITEKSFKNVAIFLSSRVAKKCISLKSLLDIESCCIRLKLNPVFIVHINDKINNEINDVFSLRKYRSYEELDGFIKNAKYIISSDSFPAHYAEYYGKRVFVVNNYANNYYLPHSAFLNKWNSVGVNLEILSKFLSTS